MAKKTNVGKVVAIALLAVVGLGSVAAIVHGRDKDEEKDKGTETHVCSFEESNVCSCGERQETILFSDVKEGMDLSGYSLRLTISEEEAAEKLVDDGHGVYAFDWGSNVVTISFSDERYKMIIGGSMYINYLEDPEEYYFVTTNLIYARGDSKEVVVEDVVLDERASSIVDIVQTGDEIEIYSYVEFYYVGLPEILPDSQNESAVASNSAVDEFDFGSITTVVADEKEWTEHF